LNQAIYRLPDEPRPTGLAKYVVDPMWPLLAIMIAGNGFGLAWCVFNAFALGTQDRIRECALAALSLLGTAALLVGLNAANANGWLAGSELHYAALSLVALKLTCAYVIYTWQSSTFEVWEHYGGRARNGFAVLFLLAFFGRNVLNAANLPDLLVAVLR